jgi:ferredoxin-NADP reductase
MTATESVTWRVATLVAVRDEAQAVRTFTFRFDEPVAHLPGQHYELRLTGDDGYQAARLYSAASVAVPGGHELELTIMRLEHGEVSPYLFEHAGVGTQIELRGPLGRYFVWDADDTRPTLLIGGGTGVVPLRAMLLAHEDHDSPMELLYSARSREHVVYKEELLDNPAVRVTLTDEAPDDWPGYTRRIDGAILMDMLEHFAELPRVYVCGPTPMVEAVANELVALGVPADQILTERFGATGT